MEEVVVVVAAVVVAVVLVVILVRSPRDHSLSRGGRHAKPGLTSS